MQTAKIATHTGLKATGVRQQRGMGLAAAAPRTQRAARTCAVTVEAR